MSPQINQTITIPIHRLGISGEGVGDYEGFTVFVDGALPGETTSVKITEKRKNFARAKLLKIEKASKTRVEPICPLFGTCGGCQIMHLDYEKQLEFKKQRVVDAFERIAKLDVPINPCRPSPQPLHYRNKIGLPTSEGKIGLYAKGSHNVIDVEKCYIHNALGEKIYKWLRSFKKIHGCNHILIRSAVHTKEVLIVLVTDSPFVPTNIPTEVKGIVHSVKKSKGNKVLGEEYRTLWGRDWIEEDLCGLKFRISAASFFQVNPYQAEHLYNQVVELANLTGEELVLDSYCGVGTLALILAKGAKKVIGVESVPEAIKDAHENAKRNNVKNAEFFATKVEEFIPKLDNVDVAVINPPRKGCEPSFLDALTKKKPKTIVYVSCDPATLARDSRLLVEKGFHIEKIQPFDMFPQTSHVECVAKFTY